MNRSPDPIINARQAARQGASRVETAFKDPASLLMDDAKIMMVDDEELNMEVLQVHLQAEGYNNFVAISDSRLAMARIRQELPDVLLLDLVMPEVTGFDILALIRSDDTLRHLPVLVLTSATDGATKLKALNLGATDFLAKPVDASELALRMRNTLAAIAWQKRISEVDPLTDLPNRTWFTQMLRNRLETANAATTKIALVLVNIDRFKSINNSLGPEHGDEVLVEFSQRLLSCYRGGEKQPWFSKDVSTCPLPTVARMDGDRFAILMTLGMDDSITDILTETTNRMRSELDEPFRVSGQSVYLAVSIGVSILRSSADSVESLVNNAETAMRHCKERTDLSYAIYSDQMDAKARERLSIENGLRTAVDNGEIYVVYQPKVDVVSNLISGAEALVRWLHPEFGLVSPVNFIDLAENSGMIVSIGEFVLREACFQTKCWHDQGFREFRIAVNVSIRQLHEPDFFDTVQCALRDSGLPPEALILELTENMIMENAETNIIKLQCLKGLGIKISIDDFGTGYSSLSYLQRFPLDQLKIDQSFIREIRSDNKPMPIVKAVTSLAHDLGLKVVAEGVETRTQLMHIRALKCEEYQGYLCSKPISAEDFFRLLKEDHRKQA